MKKIILCIILPFGFVLKAQQAPLNDFILIGKDTTFCIITTLKRATAPIVQIVYTDLNGGNEQTIEKNAIQEITTIRIGGYVMDFIPLTAAKPDEDKRHVERRVDGKIIIYRPDRLTAKTNKKGERSLYSSWGTGSSLHAIKMDKNNYYDVNKMTIKDYIIPYLNKCEAFKSGFTEEITILNLEKAVAYYNEVCP